MAQELNCNGLINNYYMHVCLDAETVEITIIIGSSRVITAPLLYCFKRSSFQKLAWP